MGAGGSRRDATLALAVYIGVSVLLFGRFALVSPAGGTLGVGPDVQVFLWGLRWWPYALGHGVNPLISTVVWGPHGADVLWATTVPLLSLLATPVTLTLGPAVAWNVLCVLAPALAAWAAYRLARELTGRRAASLLGGGLYGFSSYQLAEGMAHLQLTMSLCVPLAALYVVRHVNRRLSARGLVVRLVVIVVAQFLIAPEILASMVLFGAITAIVAAVVMPKQRRQIGLSAAGALAALTAGAAVLSPLILTMLARAPASFNGSVGYSVDLLNFVVPTRITALGGAWASSIAATYAGNPSEQTAYLGVPLLALVVVCAVSRWSSPRVRLLVFVLLVGVVLTLGRRLAVGGNASIWLPGSLVRGLPLIGNALPARFALYVFLMVSMIVAGWLAELRAHPALRWSAAALAAVSLLPATARSLWWRPTPSAIASGKLDRLLPARSRVLALPPWNFADWGLYAQATSGMRYELIDAWLQLMPASEQRLYGFVHRLSARDLIALRGPVRVDRFESALCAARIGYLVVWNHGAKLLGGLGLRYQRAGNTLVYRLPRCQRPSRLALLDATSTTARRLPT